MNSALVVESVTTGCFFEDHDTAPELSENKTRCTFPIFPVACIITIGVGKKLLVTNLFIKNSICKCPLDIMEYSLNSLEMNFCRMCQIPTEQTNNKHNITISGLVEVKYVKLPTICMYKVLSTAMLVGILSNLNPRTIGLTTALQPAY